MGSIVILTGAGISAESGLGTFRDKGGLWAKFNPTELASPRAFAKDPARVHEFYNLRRTACVEAEPNAAHLALAQLERDFSGKVLIVTQNVDDLHQRAGSADVLQMHGALLRAKCAGCGMKWQAAPIMSAEDTCPSCGAKACRPDIVWFGESLYHMVFGDIAVESPRFYSCQCHNGPAKTFSPLNELLPDHIAPELLWLETKWASLVSFGVTTDLLKDVLPIDMRLNPDTIRRHLGRVATRMEAELSDERYSFIETSPHQRAQLPNPEGQITVGIDGGYVRSRDAGQSHFEVTVGKSIPTDRPSRYLGLVQSHDDKPKRRLHEVLKDQGWQENQPVTFMTDGGDTVINMARHMAPASEHILDWFHITMRITVMQQYVKGLAHHNPAEAEAIARLLRQIKGFLWNGNLHDGQAAIEDLAIDLEVVETDYASITALRTAASEFETYIANNALMIPNYAERRRYGERVSTGFVESTVNTVVGKRFGKRQQMRWSKRGAHLMLQTRTRALDGTLRAKFEQWHPALKPSSETEMAA